MSQEFEEFIVYSWVIKMAFGIFLLLVVIVWFAYQTYKILREKKSQLPKSKEE